MTQETQEFISAEMEAAIESGDHSRILIAQTHAMNALMDCQRKTADRVKTLVANEERRAAEVEGMRKIGRVLNVAYTILGGGGVYALCKAVEALTR